MKSPCCVSVLLAQLSVLLLSAVPKNKETKSKIIFWAKIFKKHELQIRANLVEKYFLIFSSLFVLFDNFV